MRYTYLVKYHINVDIVTVISQTDLSQHEYIDALLSLQQMAGLQSLNHLDNTTPASNTLQRLHFANWQIFQGGE